MMSTAQSSGASVRGMGGILVVARLRWSERARRRSGGAGGGGAALWDWVPQATRKANSLSRKTGRKSLALATRSALPSGADPWTAR